MENLWNSFDNVNSWIRNCDSKNTILFGFIGALGLFFISDFMISKSILSNLFFILFLVTYILSIFYLIKSTFPDIDKTYNSNLFFGSISGKSFVEFDREISSSEYSLEDDLKQQIHTNSKIATKKFSNFRKAFSYLILSLITYLFYKICLSFLG